MAMTHLGQSMCLTKAAFVLKTQQLGNVMTPSPRIILIGHAPDRHGWRIMLGDVPMASSVKCNMTEAEAMERGGKVLERVGGK